MMGDREVRAKLAAAPWSRAMLRWDAIRAATAGRGEDAHPDFAAPPFDAPAPAAAHRDRCDPIAPAARAAFWRARYREAAADLARRPAFGGLRVPTGPTYDPDGDGRELLAGDPLGAE